MLSSFVLCQLCHVENQFYSHQFDQDGQMNLLWYWKGLNINILHTSSVFVMTISHSLKAHLGEIHFVLAAMTITTDVRRHINAYYILYIKDRSNPIKWILYILQWNHITEMRLEAIRAVLCPNVSLNHQPNV